MAELNRFPTKAAHFFLTDMQSACDPGDAADNVPEFFLCAALAGHTEDVRSLAVGASHLYSGARDKVVMAWELDTVRVASAVLRT